MIAVSIFMLYALMIAMFDMQLGIMFATIFLVSMMIANKLSEITGLDKKIDEWMEK